MHSLMSAFIPATGLSLARPACGAVRVDTVRHPLRVTRHATTRRHVMSSSPPESGSSQNQSPATPASSSSSLESSTTSTSTQSDAPTIVDLDADELLQRGKAVISDVSERPFYYSKIAGYGVGAIVLLTILRAVVTAIDSLPVVPAALELVGLGYAAWFVWRYVLFRESRAELLEEIDDFLGRTRPGSGSD